MSGSSYHRTPVLEINKRRLRYLSFPRNMTIRGGPGWMEHSLLKRFLSYQMPVTAKFTNQLFFEVRTRRTSDLPVNSGCVPGQSASIPPLYVPLYILNLNLKCSDEALLGCEVADLRGSAGAGVSRLTFSVFGIRVDRHPTVTLQQYLLPLLTVHRRSRPFPT
jgi:hypothetical protein